MIELLKLSDAVTAFLATGAAPVLLPIFLLVARFPNRTCTELARQHDTPLATMSRYLLSLGHGSLDLVQTKAEAADARYVRHSLTIKGVCMANGVPPELKAAA